MLAARAKKTAGCPRSRAFRDLGFHCRIDLEISPDYTLILLPKIGTNRGRPRFSCARHAVGAPSFAHLAKGWRVGPTAAWALLSAPTSGKAIVICTILYVYINSGDILQQKLLDLAAEKSKHESRAHKAPSKRGSLKKERLESLRTARAGRTAPAGCEKKGKQIDRISQLTLMRSGPYL